MMDLEGLQAKISETTDRRNMIVSDKNIKLVRFTFEHFRTCMLPPIRSNEALSSSSRNSPMIPKHAVYLSNLENPEWEPEK
jgi:hypothetical protein